MGLQHGCEVNPYFGHLEFSQSYAWFQCFYHNLIFKSTVFINVLGRTTLYVPCEK